MKEKDKLWLAVYIDVADIPEPTKSECVLNAEDYFASRNDGSVEYIVIASDENKIQLIYDPKGYRNKNNKENLRLAKEYLKTLKK